MYRLSGIDEAAGRVWNDLKNGSSGPVWAFGGGMGAGKTTFIHALCRQLGVKGTMSSPTFSIINEYQAGLSAGTKAADQESIYHIDLYRCQSQEEVIRAGVEDCLLSGHTCFVEWPARAPDIFPPGTVCLRIEEVDETTRRLVVHPGR